MSDRRADPRAVAALADAIDAAVDTWDAGSLPAWARGDPDRRALAEAVVNLLSQYGYCVSPLPPAEPADPGYGLESSIGSRAERSADSDGR
jgi:hypothetical protein